MSSNKSIYCIVGITVLAVVAFGGYKLWHHTMVSSQNMSSTSGSVQQTISPSSTSATPSGLSNKSNTSNQQLDQDVQNIQSSMNQLQQDQSTTNNDVNASSQDTPQQ